MGGDGGKVAWGKFKMSSADFFFFLPSMLSIHPNV